MNAREESTLMNIARSSLTVEELETLAGLIRLRHSPRAYVRISANVELIPMMSNLLAKIKGVC
jgi:hypothetical protein